VIVLGSTVLQGRDWVAVKALRKSESAPTVAALVSGGIPPVIVQRVFVKAPPEPTAPVITESVQVTAVPPRTENPDAAPSDTWAAAEDVLASSAAAASKHVERNFRGSFMVRFLFVIVSGITVPAA
jgi:hypothetical protein